MENKLSLDEIIMDIKRGNVKMKDEGVKPNLKIYEGTCEVCGHVGEVTPSGFVVAGKKGMATTEICIDCLLKINEKIEDGGEAKRKFIEISKAKLTGSL